MIQGEADRAFDAAQAYPTDYEEFFCTIVSAHPPRAQGHHPDAPVATVRMLTELSSSCFSLIGTERALERVAIGTYQTFDSVKVGATGYCFTQLCSAAQYY